MRLMEKKDIVNYMDLIARSEEAKKDGVVGEDVIKIVDSPIDYFEEYRKQTGKDLGTGDFVVQ